MLPVAESVKLRLKEYLSELLNTGNVRWFGMIKPGSVPAGKAILGLPPAEQVEFVIATLELRTVLSQEHGWDTMPPLEALRNALLKKSLPLADEHIEALARGLVEETRHYMGPDKSILGAIEKYRDQHALSEPTLAQLQKARRKYPQTLSTTDARRALQRLDALVSGKANLQLVPGEAWTDAAIVELGKIGPAEREVWIRLLDHCQQATSGSPTAKWLKESESLVSSLGEGKLRERLLAWLPLVDRPRPGERLPVPQYGPDPNLLPTDANVDILKGLVWCAARFDDRDMARALGAAAVSAYKKVPGVGPRAVKLGNACVYALGAMPGQEGLGQLALLKVKVKFGTAQKGIEKALTAVAARLGLPRDEIEELAVPTYGLEEVGLRRESLGDFTAELVAAADGTTELRWRKADGKPQKSVPAAVKSEFAEDLKELKAAAKDIAKMLPAQKDRIDNLYLASKRWPLATWRERYLDHPLLGVLARGLLWEFSSGGQSQTGGFLADAAAGQLVGLDDRPLVLSEDAAVQLWHPIGRPTADVLAWREWLERHEIRQPFKQAHREVYVLTDAERNTRVYSNRFAAHIVKQHQYNALCGIRGWKNQLRLMVDADYPPTMRMLPAWGLRAEFWVEGAGDQYGTDTNETGTYLYLATDQVRFYPLDAPELHAHAWGRGYGRYQGPLPDPIPLEQIPPLVFSEIMRDVDLFVGVASVGNDPNWLDGGREGLHADYWQSYSFGDLSATAQTRKAVLERIVPRLAIGSRCSFEDKFLVVEGKLRTYKIHLGSGNILMKPNDEYLCIVPSRGEAAAGDKVFLPFEGDRTLSIILSKALLLAADDKIADPTITRQIGRR
jgi:hypothetical protein